MNKNLENIIIDGDVRNIFTAHYSKEDSKTLTPCKLYRFTNQKLPCTSAEIYAKDTNALYILNRYLAKIIENKDEYKQIKVYLNTSLYNKIVTGKYKHWVETGETLSGTTLDTKEVNEWRVFVNLYAQVFTKITFYRTDLFSMKNFKYNKEEMEYGRVVYNKLHGMLIKKAEEDLNKKLMNM